jgi:hypothetical protein
MQVVAVCYDLSDSKEQLLALTATALQRTISRLGGEYNADYEISARA